MNVWLAAVVAAAPALAVCSWVCVRSQTEAAAIAYQTAGGVATVVLMLLAEGLRRSILWDLALVAAVSQLAGGLAFARFVEGRLWRRP